METTDFKEGQLFRFEFFTPNKIRSMNKVIQLPDRTGIPEKDRNKFLVIFDGCKQMVIDNLTEIKLV